MASGYLHPVSSLDFGKLCETFAQICPDFYDKDPENSGKSESLDFANKVLFEVAPKMRHLKKEGSNEMWRLIFSGGQSVYIHTYTFRQPVNRTPCVKENKLYLTLKQAGLLAVRKLCSVLPDVHKPRDKILLTPLSLAVFAPESIPKIAKALGQLMGMPVNIGVIVKAVISSCQTDGYRLPHSQCHIALVAIDATVRVAQDREKLRSYILHRYSKFGKVFDENHYKIYSQYSKKSGVIKELPAATDKQTLPLEKQNVSEVLRNIIRSIDDPLSGRTLNMTPINPPAATDEDDDKPNQSLPIDIHIEQIDMTTIKSKLLTKKP